MTAWADIKDSFDSQSQDNPPPLFTDGLSQLSQSSCNPNPSQLFPATPDSFEGSQLSQQMLRQRFAGSVAVSSPVDSIDEADSQPLGTSDMAVNGAGHDVDGIVAPRTPDNSRQITNSGATPITESRPLGYSFKSLQKAATAMAASAASPVHRGGNKQKRGSQKEAHTPLGKRPRSTLAPINGSPTGRPAVCAQLPDVIEGGDVDIENINENAEESKERRLQKRSNAVISIKKKEEYRVFEQIKREGRLSEMVASGIIKDIPLTPDPEAIDITSKRTWEKGVQEWRAHLRCVSKAVSELPS